MQPQLIALLAFLSPLVFIATAVMSWFQPGMRPAFLKKMAIASTLVSILVAAVCGVFVIQFGLLETALLGINDIGFSLRLDAVSMVMLSMIALLGFIVMRFSLNYLDGDGRQGVFIGRLAATIASVQLLVLSGNLGLLFISWVLTSMSLHRLLVFYRERPGAIIAARKKFIVARLGDACLLAASVILFAQFGTGNIETIFQAIKTGLADGTAMAGIEAAALLLAAAAMLKSAQFPAHGWLIEVMETPTPVSALLHAGLLNAGPFLIIRMAYVMEASTFAPIILIVLGGFTALFASVVFLTQTSVKTALGYSSVAHMGFSLMVCGLGVYPAAMLHLVAHSFYKAHSFLSSGSTIDLVRAAKVTGGKRIGNPFKIILGILTAISLYLGYALIWGIQPDKDLGLLAIGAIMILGLSRLFTSAFDSNGSIKVIFRVLLLSFIVITSFFVLESATHYILFSQLPELVQPSFVETIIIATLLSLFAVVVFVQILSPVLASNQTYRALAVHLKNGLYVNTLFDRTVRALYSHGLQPKPTFIDVSSEQTRVSANESRKKEIQEQVA
jgi:NAD(P)H-quinone oxidoreductase subunit 5